jgi:hypothetical protein
MDTSHSVRTTAASLSLLALLGCGEDLTSPAPSPVSGLYEAQSETRVAICDPASAFDILEPTLGDLSMRLRVRVEEDGGQVTMTLVHAEGFDGRPVNFDAVKPVTTPILADGAVQYQIHLSDRITLAGRTFYDETTISTAGRFDRGADPITLTLQSTGTQVYREGDPSAPVYASCTQTETTSGARTGD